VVGAMASRNDQFWQGLTSTPTFEVDGVELMARVSVFDVR
jgi:hypothetical protein